MKKTKRNIIILVVIIVVGFLYYQNHQAKKELERRDNITYVKNYLEDKGFKDADIKKLYTTYNSKSGRYDVNVIFKNEPGVRYRFFKSEQDLRIYLDYAAKFLSNGHWEQIQTPQSETKNGSNFN